MTRLYFVIMMVFGALFYTSSVQAEESTAIVSGQLFAGSNFKPAPGLRVSLAHPKLGRSASASSDEFGRFTLIGIPIDRDPYFIEVYWGNELVYRETIYVTESELLLPPIYL